MKVVINQYITPLILDKEITFIEKMVQRMNRRIRATPFAKATVEMALFDALAKLYQLPVHPLLGSLYQDNVPATWALASGTAEGDIEESKDSVSSTSCSS